MWSPPGAARVWRLTGDPLRRTVEPAAQPGPGDHDGARRRDRQADGEQAQAGGGDLEAGPMTQCVRATACTDNRDGAKFCKGCGRRLVSPTPVPPAGRAPPLRRGAAPPPSACRSRLDARLPPPAPQHDPFRHAAAVPRRRCSSPQARPKKRATKGHRPLGARTHGARP